MRRWPAHSGDAASDLRNSIYAPDIARVTSLGECERPVSMSHKHFR